MVSDLPTPLKVPVTFSERPRVVQRSSLLHLNNNSDFPNFTFLEKFPLAHLHVAAVAQIMSVQPEHDLLTYIDWCNVANSYIRVSPAFKSNPLSFVWPENTWSLFVTLDFNVNDILNHCSAVSTAGTIIVLDPSHQSHKRLLKLCFVSLEFQKNDPIFVGCNAPSLVRVYFINNFSQPHKAPPKTISIAIHPRWDELVILPKNTVNIEYFKKHLAYHPRDEEYLKCIDSLEFGVSYEMSDALSRTNPLILKPSSSFDWSEISPLMKKDNDRNWTSGVFDWNSKRSTLDLPLFNLLSQSIFVNYKKISKKPRKINNLSGAGANLCQTYDHEKVWHGFTHAKNLLRFFGPGCLFKKNDIVAAYKIPPLKPQDFRVAGESIPKINSVNNHAVGGLILNLRTIFGGTNSFKMFDQALGYPLHFIFKKLIHSFLSDLNLVPSENFGLLRWSDDFISMLCGDSSFEPRWKLADDLSKIIDNIILDSNVAMSSTPFSTSMVILGLGLDGILMEAFLTEARRIYSLHLVQSWIEKFYEDFAPLLAEWQSMVGTLRFSSLVIECAKTFCSPFDSEIGRMTKNGFRKTKISKSIFTCLCWFENFFEKQENCRKSIITDLEWTSARDLGLIIKGTTMDACFWGRGFLFGNEYFSGKWPAKILALAWRRTTYDINFLEAFNCVDVAATLGSRWKGKKVVMETDSKAWEQVWLNGKAQCPYLSALLICLVDICNFYHFTLRIIHIAGVDNVYSDLLSRDCLQEFLKVFPNAKPLKLLKWPTDPCWPV